MSVLEHYLQHGWARFPAEDAVAAWVESVLASARAARTDPAHAQWLRCGGTWFVGVDALPNDSDGRVAGGPPLTGAAMAFLRSGLALDLPLHKAQLSICYPGYPQPSPEESEQAHRYRLTRCSAHVDGLHAEGPARRRHLKEAHAFIIGITLTDVPDTAAPLVAWSGSHRLMQQAFATAYASLPPERWAALDVTEPYQDARRLVFERCPRVRLACRPGEAVLLHRHVLHGIEPWPDDVAATPDGRMIAYFRPEFPAFDPWLHHG